MTFSLGALLNSSAWNVFRMRDRIDMNPVYQREGDVWTLEKKQLLVDTIINGFDVPKIYMHKFPKPIEHPGGTWDYAVIDGKQRLSAIWGFIQGQFSLAEDFTYVKDEAVNAAGFTYADLSRQYPDVKADFDAYHLSVVTIETQDIELIEDMFSRLNEAMPLNAAEKRNARPGPLPAAVRELVKKPFFAAKLPFTNRRYRHFDLAAKMLFFASRDTVSDTKKAYIDRFFEMHSRSTDADLAGFVAKATEVVDVMGGLFIDKDPLLRSVGMVSLYFLLFERALERGLREQITRPALEQFERTRRENRIQAEAEIAGANYELLEFDRYTQSPNDAVAMRFRLAVIDKLMLNGQLGFEFPD